MSHDKSEFFDEKIKRKSSDEVIITLNNFVRVHGANDKLL